MTHQIPAIRFWLRTIGPACAELPAFRCFLPNPNQPEFRSCRGIPPLRDGPNRRPSGRNDKFWVVDDWGEVNFGEVGCPQDNRLKWNEMRRLQLVNFGFQTQQVMSALNNGYAALRRVQIFGRMRYALAAVLPGRAGAYETGSRLHSDDADDRGHDAERHGDPGTRHGLRDVDCLALAARRRDCRGNPAGSDSATGYGVACHSSGRADLRAEAESARGRNAWLRKIM